MENATTFYDNGNLHEIGFEDDLGRQGKWTFYNEDGSIFKEVDYKDDKCNGDFVRYHSNGIVALQTTYANGVMDGKGVEFYENGSIKEEWSSQNGNYSPINYWDEAGNQLLKEGTGKMPFYYGTDDHKIVEKYFENGKVVKEVVIKDDGFIVFDFIPDNPEDE